MSQTNAKKPIELKSFKAHSHNMHLTCVQQTGPVQKIRKLSAETQLSAAAAHVKCTLCESAFKVTNTSRLQTFQILPKLDNLTEAVRT